jgi:ATP-dependent exoDNAse (exonuclease V) alpha subunit
MHELLKLADRQSARIIFSGDTKQIQSVEAGDALRVLENESRLKSTSLTQVQRQITADYRNAIQELRRDPEAGFEKLDRIGAVHEVGWSDRAQAVAQAYAESKGRDVLVVCATHDEIDRVTEAIRASRKQNGDLGESLQVPRDVSLNWTAAQKSDYGNYRPGQRLTFHRAVKGITKNETLAVLWVEGNGIVACSDRGEERTLTAKQSKPFEVYERRTIEVAAGDKLLLTANRRDANFRATNGEIVTVSRVDKDGRMRLDDGRQLPADFKQFTHGYAVTAHRSQGKSVDSVVISGDGMQKELFYVAASRGRRSVQIITSDKDPAGNKFMPRASKGRSAVPTAEQIAEKAARGQDISAYFTNTFTVVRPVKRVNVDLTRGMLRELDARAARLNISRQAVIKTLLGRTLDEERLNSPRPKKRAEAPSG